MSIDHRGNAVVERAFLGVANIHAFRARAGL
jgi:hypothetical protein